MGKHEDRKIELAIAKAIAEGLVEHDPATDTLSITDKGRKQLADKGG